MRRRIEDIKSGISEFAETLSLENFGQAAGGMLTIVLALACFVAGLMTIMLIVRVVMG